MGRKVVRVLSLLMVAVGAFAQGLTGMGFGLLCAPFLIATSGPVEGVRQVVFLSLLLNIVFFLGEARYARGSDALRLLLPALLVAPLLSVWLHRLQPDTLLVVAGGLTLVSAGVLALGWRWSRLRGPAGVVSAGALSAAMNVAAGLAGPAVAMYAVNAAWPTRSGRPTLQLYGCGLNLVTLFNLGFPALRWPLLLSLAVGVLGSLLLVQHVPQERVRQAILGLAALGGVLVIWRGLG